MKREGAKWYEEPEDELLNVIARRHGEAIFLFAPSRFSVFFYIIQGRLVCQVTCRSAFVLFMMA